MHSVQVRMLGPLEIWVDGLPVEIGGPRQQAVLAMLLLERGRPVSTDRLVDAVWGDDAPAGALSALYAYVTRLRKGLGGAGALLKRSAAGYVLDLPAESVDAWRFDALVGGITGSLGITDTERIVSMLTDALSWWNGRVLDGRLSDHSWTGPLRAHLEERRLGAIETLADAYLLLRQHEAAVVLLTDAVTEHPDREGLVSRLMVSLYRASRQADALAVYGRCRAWLASELGLEPSEQLRDMHAAILEQRAQLLPPGTQGRLAPRLLPLRNPRFFGRADLVDKVTSLLERSQMVTLEGIGGAGKSVIALEVAHAHQGYSCWINAENEAATFASLASIAGDRGIASAVSGADHSRVLRDLWSELGRERAPLFVFDNAVDPAVLNSYLPRMEHARILVTSRSAGWGALGERVSVGSFTSEEAVTYLSERTGSQDREAAIDLAEDLGRLPLACAQAAAFIEQAQIDIRRYRVLFGRRREELLRRAAPDGYGQTVGTTWQLAFEHLAVEAPAAATLLEAMAFLSPDGVDEELVRGLFSSADPDLELADAVADLRRYSLINRDGSTLMVHRLVQAVVRSRLDPAARTDRLTTAAQLLASIDPGDPSDPVAWPAWSTSAPHIIVVGELCEEYASALPLIVPMLRSAACYLHQRGLFRTACKVLKMAVDLSASGTHDPRVLAEMHSELGHLYDLNGEVHAARDEHARAVELLQNEFPRGHERITLARAQLAHLLNCAGDPTTAVALLEEAMPILRNQSRPRDRIKACVDLGYAQWSIGALSEAAECFDEALGVMTSTAPTMPDLYAEALSGMGMVRQDQGHLHLAAELIERAVATLNDLFDGDDHPALAQMHDKNGFVLRLLGDLEAAVSAHSEAHRMLTITVGATDPRTAMALSNLGLAYLDAGRLSEAADAQQQAQRLMSNAYGPDHRNTLIVTKRLHELQAFVTQ